MVKPWLDPVTKDKFNLYGGSGYQEELLKIIDAEKLPTMFGGKLDTEVIFAAGPPPV